MNEEGIFSLKSLSSVINKYLEKRKDHTERWLLTEIKKSYGHFKVKDIKHEHFDSFLRTLSASEASMTSYMYRLSPFKKYIGLSQKEVKENPTPTNKEYHELERTLTLHRETIDRERAEHKAETEKLHETIDTLKSKSMEIEKIKNLEATTEEKKAEKDKATKELTEIMNHLSHAKLYTIKPCPKTLRRELLVECLKCEKQLECPVIAEHWE